MKAANISTWLGKYLNSFHRISDRHQFDLFLHEGKAVVRARARSGGDEEHCRWFSLSENKMEKFTEVHHSLYVEHKT